MKSLLDKILALILLVLFSPFMIITALMVFFKIDKSIFFTQERPGLNEKIFTIYKFKTMSDERDSDGKLLPDEKRLSQIGKTIRKMSLDELPQLFNVLNGDMSFVGPRPLLVEYLELYSDEQKRRHEVKAGITGWAQVNGRNAISWEDKFKHDVWYIENQSLLLDIKILWMTFLKVIRRSDVSSNSSVTMEKFKGSSNA